MLRSDDLPELPVLGARAASGRPGRNVSRSARRWRLGGYLNLFLLAVVPLFAAELGDLSGLW